MGISVLLIRKCLTIFEVRFFVKRGLVFLVSPILFFFGSSRVLLRLIGLLLISLRGSQSWYLDSILNMGLGFTLIFIAEYSIILFFSAISAAFFLIAFDSKLIISLILVLLGFFWVWLRATYPRYRYDKLINIA